MSKKRLWLHIASLTFLTVPNLTYLGINFDILKEANAIALTMTAILVLAIVGVGTLAHIKTNAGVWVTLIGVFILALSNISYLAGMALIIEGGGVAVDGYVFKPLIAKQKIKEIESNGGTVTYTKEL